jgi:hypothetical protein
VADGIDVGVANGVAVGPYVAVAGGAAVDVGRTGVAPGDVSPLEHCTDTSAARMSNPVVRYELTRTLGTNLEKDPYFDDTRRMYCLDECMLLIKDNYYPLQLNGRLDIN